jgi:CheY-like chemotaxis protein
MYLLTAHPRIGEVIGVNDAAAALRELSERRIDAIFLDISMPGLSGIELASVLGTSPGRRPWCS